MGIFRRFGAGRGRSRSAVPAGTIGEHVHITNPWHAVSIVPRPQACAAAHAIAGKRFLSQESPPRVPLEGCTAATCACHYRHHSDRRAHADASRTSAENASDAKGTAPPRRRVDDAVTR
jgi:hypothetical protein